MAYRGRGKPPTDRRTPGVQKEKNPAQNGADGLDGEGLQHTHRIGGKVVSKQNERGTAVVALKSTTTNGKKVKITGKLTDNLKSPVMNSLVKIKINSKTVKVKTNKQGVYTYNYKTTTKGTNKVTISFPGSTNYKKTSAKTSFIVK